MPVLCVVFWMRLLFILLSSGNEREKCGTGWMTGRKKVIVSIERRGHIDMPLSTKEIVLNSV